MYVLSFTPLRASPRQCSGIVMVLPLLKLRLCARTLWRHLDACSAVITVCCRLGSSACLRWTWLHPRNVMLWRFISLCAARLCFRGTVVGTCCERDELIAYKHVAQAARSLSTLSPYWFSMFSLVELCCVHPPIAPSAQSPISKQRRPTSR